MNTQPKIVISKIAIVFYVTISLAGAFFMFNFIGSDSTAFSSLQYTLMVFTIPAVLNVLLYIHTWRRLKSRKHFSNSLFNISAVIGIPFIVISYIIDAFGIGLTCIGEDGTCLPFTQQLPVYAQLVLFAILFVTLPVVLGLLLRDKTKIYNPNLTVNSDKQGKERKPRNFLYYSLLIIFAITAPFAIFFSIIWAIGNSFKDAGL